MFPGCTRECGPGHLSSCRFRSLRRAGVDNEGGWGGDKQEKGNWAANGMESRARER